MYVLLFILVVAAVILMESRLGNLRWMLAQAGERISKLEATIRDLQQEVAAFRGSAPKGPALGTAQTTDTPSPEPSPLASTVPSLPDPASATAGPANGADPALAPTSGGTVPPIAPPTATQPSFGPPPPSGVSLEERLGTRWAVWVGGVALALGALLMVRYAIEQGFFGPAARITFATLFSMSLLAAGEWFRRSGFKPSLDAIPAAHIPSVLTAAGSVGLFGTVYAAYALYGFIGPALAFVLLGVVGIATMLGSALHGPALAGLGLVGAYVAPLLVSTGNARPWPVVIYLGVIAASALGLARIRQWLWLALVAVGGAFLWGLVFVEPILFRSFEWTLGGYLHTWLQLALAAVAIAILPYLGTRDQDAQPEPTIAAALVPLSLLAVIMLGAGRYQLEAAVPFTLAIAAILLATAWISARAAHGANLAGVMILVSILLWPGLRVVTDKSYLLHEVAGVLLVPENVVSYLTFASLAALGVTAVATLRLMRGQALPLATAAFYVLAATLTPLIALVFAYLRVTQFDTSISFAFAATVLGLVFAFLADRFQRAEIDELPGTRLATGAYASAAIAALSFGLVAFFSRGYLTVALSLAALGTAFVAVRRDIPALRHVVAALAAIVLARIVWDPRIMGDGVGKLPILNWLLIGYGVPAASFFRAARLMERKGADTPARLADAVAVLLAGLLCFFEIHHVLNDGDALSPRFGHVEMGLLALVGFGLSWALMRLDLGRGNPIFYYGSIAYGVLSTLGVLIGLGLAENPLFNREFVKGPTVFSSLLIAYLLPGLAAVLLARAARPWRPAWYVTGIAIAAVLLIFGYVTLEVRHAFQGEDIRLSMRRVTGPEMWSYSMAWLWLGLVFLAYGIFRGSLEARIASAALVILTVFKVFIFDLAGITGLWRALSFIGLGIVLIGIGLAYQHLLFGQRTRPVPPAPAPEPTAT